ncbi:erythromycin esterase family protein [Chelativorans sp. AA-79]|uniref:erythromycin esterase family protein n=1 Tax=Chelativorans sp. AA-79 TaxID=3028735 RepID=UPI0023F77D79|nr:erythromycin esterase family protein [Chelativorans sp. AA-79]WEX09527.1 erythromycin esterase family protein [Chelativorans sp. AA-79]
MVDATTTERSRTRHTDEAASWIRDKCESLPPPEKADAFGALFDRFSDARVVLLGEATHGTAEFYRARAAVTRRLVEKHGFNIVAVEADWPDAARVDRHVRHRPSGRYDAETFARFPSWMWRNREFADFVEWLLSHNRGLPEARRAEFRGIDVYSLDSSIEAVIGYLDRVDPEAAKKARERYGCLTPWQGEPAHYGRAMLRGGRDTCEDAVVAQLQEMLEHRLDYAARDGEDFFDAAQNASIVRAAEHYYRILYHGSTESWNLRDRHMFDTLRALLARRGPEAKAVIWAHNSHIGNAAATAMGWQGEFNIGELCRTAFGDGAALIGFGTDRGTVAAADDWGAPMRIMNINPSRPDSYEHVFRKSGITSSLTDLRAPAGRELRDALSSPRLERAIGVVYRPESELYSHYFEAVLPEQFDAFVWFEDTRAVTPLPTERPHGVPETYPFGV